MDFAGETIAMKRNQRMEYPFWRRVQRTNNIHKEGEIPYEIIEDSIPGARWPLLFAHAVPLGQWHNDAVLLIKKNQLVEVFSFAVYATNLRGRFHVLGG